MSQGAAFGVIDLQTGNTYRFGDFELQPDEHRLLVGGAPIALGTRAFNLLLALVEHAGQLVTKDALLERVWPGVVVEENNLQVQISTLRKMLGGDAIATVVGKGYRFTPEIIINAPVVVRGQHYSLYKQSNLPHHLSVLIGREQELPQLQEVLTTARLVTVTGPGGVGKTRLMIACAQEIEYRFGGGAWLIELANQNDPQMVAVAVAACFGIEVKDAASATEAISRFVREKHLLLLLDNCEHLVDAVAALVESLLAIAPQLQVMTTSQDILGLSGEQVFRVPSLLLPVEEVINAEAALNFGAIKLFVERAKLGESNFRCDDENAGTIAAICRRLDGIPLAIEMAAARVSTLGLTSLAQLLDERFLALTAGRRSAIPRHQTLQATLDWSYSLLAERERIVFRRLAGFVGGFSLAAASAVGADADLDHNDVIDAVSILVTKSLLTVDTSQGQWRYRLLEVSRAYALQRLAESGESQLVARRAAEHYVSFFQPCFDDWTRLSDDAFDARYAPDLDNLRLALDWAFAPGGDPRIGLELTAASGHLWIGRLMISESQRRITQAFSYVDAQTPALLEAHLQLVAGVFFYWREWQRSITALQAAAPVLRSLGDIDAAGYALLWLSNNYILAGVDDPAQALAAATDMLKNSDRLRLITLLRKTTAMYHHILGNAALADEQVGEALQLARQGGFEIVALTLEENMVDSMWLAGNLSGALKGAREVVEKCKRVKVASKIGWNWVYGNLFGILVEANQLAEAAEIGRINMPYLREANTAWTRMDHYALYLSKVGHYNEAALVHGWISHYFATNGISRQPNEFRAKTFVEDALLDRFGKDELTALMAKGAQLTEQDVCVLALT